MGRNDHEMSSPYEGAAERMDAVSRSCALKLRIAVSRPSMVAMSVGGAAYEKVERIVGEPDRCVDQACGKYN